MENLTLAQRIIKPHTVDPLDGHTVVVIERVGDAGEEFRFEIEPNMRAPKTKLDLFKWLRGGRGGPNYFAYAVNSHPQLRLEYAAPMKMDDQIHSFDVIITLGYHVSEPRVVVVRRNDDPIRTVRKEIAFALQRELADRSWIGIVTEFREVAAEAVVATFDSLQRFAESYGLAIDDVSLAHELPEPYLILLRKEAEAERDAQLYKVQADLDRVKIREDSVTGAIESERIHEATVVGKRRELELTSLTQEREHEELVRQKKREHDILKLEDIHTLDREEVHGAVSSRHRLDQIADAAAAATVTAFRNIGNSISTAPELLQVVGSLQTTVAQARALLEGNSGPVAHEGAVPRLGDGKSGPGDVILEMFASTSRMNLGDAKPRLQSAILHLIAELLLDRHASSERIAEYRDRILAIRAETQLPFEHFESLKRFVDVERLRDEMH